MALRATYRDAGPVTVVDLSGRITLGDGSALLRETIRVLESDTQQLREHQTCACGDIDYSERQVGQAHVPDLERRDGEIARKAADISNAHGEPARGYAVEVKHLAYLRRDAPRREKAGG